MTDRYRPVLRLICLTIMVMALSLLVSTEALADVVGRLKVTVKNADGETPITGAKVTFKDSANIRPTIVLTTDAKGVVTSPSLENRSWTVTAEADKFNPESKMFIVVADTTTEVELFLESAKEQTVKITSNKQTIDSTQTNNDSHRDQKFIQTFPSNVGNPQSISDILRTNPGFAQDSVNQVHPRGEHSATAYNLNGFYLPGALQGRAGQLLTPDAIQSLDALTGGYSPEYGGETAAVLNISLRSGPIKSFQNFELMGGSYDTFYGALTLGGQFGKSYGAPDADGSVAKRFSYLMNFSARTTRDLLEPPNPDNQTAHNTGSDIIGFGNFTYDASSRDRFDLVLSTSPANNQVADRTGLPAVFSTVGQGYGYVGLRNQNGTFPTASAPTALGAAPMALGSQLADKQDIFTRDINSFGVLNYRHTFNSNLVGLFSYGNVYSGQDVKNNSPFINQADLPIDNSIEFNPTVIRNEHQNQLQSSLTYSVHKHTFKAGFQLDSQIGNEYYQLIPGSQLALDSLANNAPNLAPKGTPLLDTSGNPVVDAVGNPVYQLASGATAPGLTVHKSGFYDAFYGQDTWAVSKRFTVNYGLRLDWYKQDQFLTGKLASNVNTADLGPRINTAYLLTPLTVFRASYNRLFIQPPLAQGSVVGAAVVPETLDQFDVSIERQLTSSQTVKLAAYYKNDQNQIDTNLLIPFTQIGVFTSVNFQKGNARGVEFSYNLTPRNYIGTSGYFSWANSLDKPEGLQNTGAPVPLYNDHDALNIISTGVAYTLKSGANVGLNLYYSSGTASSVVFPTDALGNGKRAQRSELNFGLSTGPGLFGGSHNGKGGHGGIKLTIENLLDHRSVVNFDSGFSGTRFQQGRRIQLGVFGSF